jgi:transcriptional regulator with XRE-family HTH domain
MAEPHLVMRQVKALKKRRGISQQQIVQRVKALGGEISQSAVARLESGATKYVSVDDLFLLSAALDVAPVELLGASFDPPKVVPIVGRVKLTPRATRDWVRGSHPLPDGDELAYFGNVSDEQRKADLAVRGLWALRSWVSEYEEAALEGDVDRMAAILDELRSQLDSQQRQLEMNPAHWTVDRAKRRQRRKGSSDAS